MRIGDRTDYNRVRLNIETDGSLTPREALAQAVRILVDQFKVLGEGFVESDEVAPATDIAEEGREKVVQKSSAENDAFKVKLDELKFSARTLNALREAGVKTVGGLARKRGSTLREIEGIGEKGIQEIKKALGNFGITLKQ